MNVNKNLHILFSPPDHSPAHIQLRTTLLLTHTPDLSPWTMNGKSVLMNASGTLSIASSMPTTTPDQNPTYAVVLRTARALCMVSPEGNEMAKRMCIGVYCKKQIQA